MSEPHSSGEKQLETLPDRLPWGEVARASQVTTLTPPTPSPTALPFHQLDPGVFERLAAEVLSRRNNRGVHFYGRSGQKQYGLDVVEFRLDGEREVYQVRRYAEFGPAELKKAVSDFATAPRPKDVETPGRRFEPVAFVVFASAGFDHDTANVDALAELNSSYEGDLQIDVWGAEAVSRQLRDAPGLVGAVFGAAWAEAWCGVRPTLPDSPAPDSLGFVESPITVLGLDGMAADAATKEATDPAEAAALHRRIADALAEAGFHGHAEERRKKQAHVLRDADAHAEAFEVLSDLAMSALSLHTADPRSDVVEELVALGTSVGPVAVARASAVKIVSSWQEWGCQLPALVPALAELIDAEDRLGPLLVCLALEQAVVDGWFDFDPPDSPFGAVDDSTAQTLARLLEISRSASPTELDTRTRLRTALADATLTMTSPLADVDAAFHDLVEDAHSGRLLRLRGVVLARAAFAHGARGYTDRAETLWRAAVLNASEDGNYGDVRDALRSIMRTHSDGGSMIFGHERGIRALPNRKKMLAGAYDPALIAYEKIHRGKIPDAFGETRNSLWQARIGGALEDWLISTTLLADVLVAAGRTAGALHLLCTAGLSQEAEEVAKSWPEWFDSRRWLDVPNRRVRTAAVRTQSVQLALVPDGELVGIQHALAQVAISMWDEHWGTSPPGAHAVKALARCGDTLDRSLVDPVIGLVGPAREKPTRASEDIAELLVQLYWAVPERRGDLGEVIGDMLRLESPPHNLWGLLQAMPAEGRDQLLPTVKALADAGSVAAFETLADWGEPAYGAQVLARMACAEWLREPVGTQRTSWSVTNRASHTAAWLRFLVEVEEPREVPVEQLLPSVARPAGGTFFSVQYGRRSTSGSEAASAETPKAPEGDTPPEPDEAATLAAGPVAPLVRAVLTHMVAVAADETQYAAERVNALRALEGLIDLMEPDVAHEVAEQMRAVAKDPAFSEVDEFERASLDPLSRYRFDNGVERLRPLALLTAALCLARAIAQDDAPPEGGGHPVDSLFIDALPFLRSGDPDLQWIGARVVSTLATLPGGAHLARTLLTHPNDRVRSLGAEQASGSPELLDVLARDPARQVRAAVAARVDELSPEVKERLRKDRDSRVRWLLGHSTDEPGAGGDEPSDCGNPT